MEVLANIRQGTDLAASLAQLGTVLRDEIMRNDADLVAAIPELVDLFCRAEDAQVIQESFRVLINLCADNDANRDAVVARSDLWDAVKRRLADFDRSFLLINQFIYNTDHLKNYMDELYQQKLHVALLDHLRSDSSHAADIVSCLAELLDPDRVLSDEQFQSNVVQYVQILVEAEPDEDDDYFLNLSKVLCNITSYDDLPGLRDVALNTAIIDFMSAHPFSSTFANRQFFSTVGQVTSMRSYDNLKEVTHAIEQLSAPIANLYVKAAYYLVIGNYINSQEKSEQISRLVGSRFVETFFATRFTDLVQFQSIHMVKNLLNRDSAKDILNNFDQLRWGTKIVRDNKQYYPEIYSTYVAFLLKLIRVGFGQMSIYEFADYWLDLDDADVYAALAEHLQEEDNELNDKIVASLFLDDWPQDAAKLLARLKFQSIVLKSHTNYTSQKVSQSSDTFAQQLRALEEMLAQKSENPQYAMILNNSRFVAGLVVSAFSGEPQRLAKQILSL